MYACMLYVNDATGMQLLQTVGAALLHVQYQTNEEHYYDGVVVSREATCAAIQK